MNMNNKIRFNDKNTVEIEYVHLDSLIEEQYDFDEKLLSKELSIDEIDYIVSEYKRQNQEIDYSFYDSEDDLFNPFEHDDYQDQLRDEKLIEEREIYESNYHKIIPDDFALNDFFDFQIEAMEEENFILNNGYGYDFKYELECCEHDYYDEDMFYEQHYPKKYGAISNSYGCYDFDYMPHDNEFCDYLDCYDYPEGPKENLSGIRYY